MVVISADGLQLFQGLGDVVVVVVGALAGVVGGRQSLLRAREDAVVQLGRGRGGGVFPLKKEELFVLGFPSYQNTIFIALI